MAAAMLGMTCPTGIHPDADKPHESLVDNLRNQMRHQTWKATRLEAVRRGAQTTIGIFGYPGANCTDERIIVVQFLNG